MKKQFFFDKNGKETGRPLGFSGKIKQIFINSYRTEGTVDPNNPVEKKVVTKLTNTKVDLNIGGLRLLEDYYGSPTDEFNLIEEVFEVGDMTKLEVNIDGELLNPAGGDTLKYPVILTFIYELPEKQRRTVLK